MDLLRCPVGRKSTVIPGSQFGAYPTWRDNVFVERFRRSLKYEEVYLRAYDSASEAKHFMGRSISFYNEHRPHPALDGRTPDDVYFNQPAAEAA